MVFQRQPGERTCLHPGTPEGVVRKFAVRIAEVNAIGIKSRAYGATSVSGSRRNENPLETGFLENPVIGDTIERHAAAQAKVGQARLLVKRLRGFHQYVFKNPLNARGAVGIALTVWRFQVDWVEGVARRSKQIDELRGK